MIATDITPLGASPVPIQPVPLPGDPPGPIRRRRPSAIRSGPSPSRAPQPVPQPTPEPFPDSSPLPPGPTTPPLMR